MGENFIVINGVRYDLVPDFEEICNGCALVDVCLRLPENFNLCGDIFDCPECHFIHSKVVLMPTTLKT